VYPALRRLDRAGLVASNWEAEQNAKEEQRPIRRYYVVTPTGAEVLGEAQQRYPLLRRMAGVRSRVWFPQFGRSRDQRERSLRYVTVISKSNT